MSGNLKLWRESASLILTAKAAFVTSDPFNYKILLLKRSSKSEFMPDTYVFPGGNISKSDASEDWWHLYKKFGFSKQSFHDLRPVDNVPSILRNDENRGLPKYLSFRICAIREAFEECGILLCKSPKINRHATSKWASFVGGQELISWQHKVYAEPEEFLNLCEQFDVYPDVWSLNLWSNWMTPPALKLRFNTIFFLAALNQMPPVHKDKKEVQILMWISPDKCIQMNYQQTLSLPVPQFYEISRLKVVSDINVLSQFAKERNKHGTETYWPFRITSQDGLCSILPGDDLYPNIIHKDDTIVPKFNLPDGGIKNRILHKADYVHIIQTDNFTPKCYHIAPLPTN